MTGSAENTKDTALKLKREANIRHTWSGIVLSPVKSTLRRTVSVCIIYKMFFYLFKYDLHSPHEFVSLDIPLAFSDTGFPWKDATFPLIAVAIFIKYLAT